MSLFNSIKNIFGTWSISSWFYQNSKVEKVEWWLAWCNYYPDLFWARLRVFSNGRADVLFQDGDKTYGFDKKEYAEYFLSEDEFFLFQNLDKEDKKFLEIPPDFSLELPNWTDKEVKEFRYIGNY